MSPLALWLLLAGPAWSVVGAVGLPRLYRRRGQDPQRAGLAGGVVGACSGPAGLAVLALNRSHTVKVVWLWAAGVLLLWELLWLFARAYPENSCVTDSAYVLNQVQNGIGLGLIYAVMAVGLALIFSVMRIVNFAHGQLFMLGGVVAYYVTPGMADLNPLVALPVVAVACLIVGLVVERLFLSPLQSGKLDRPMEYALLVTFGVGILISYSLVGFLGTSRGLRTPRYTDHPLFGLDQATYEVGPLLIRTDIWIAGAVGLLLVGLLTVVLRWTWTGRALRAVSMDREAAATVGIHPRRVHAAAFGIGAALAGVGGALLIPIINFAIPQVAFEAAVRAYIIIVLGGLGSVPGALLGAMTLGVTEALGAGCFPDPGRAATYQLGFGLVLFTVVLLVRPQGFFGGRR